MLKINCPYCHAPQDIEIQAIGNSYACGECGKTYKVFIAVATDGAKPIKSTMQQEPQPSALVYLVNALTYKDPKTGNYHSAVGEHSNVTHIVNEAIRRDAEDKHNIAMRIIEKLAVQDVEMTQNILRKTVTNVQDITCILKETAINWDAK